MGTLLQAIVGFFVGDAGKTVGGTVTNIATITALIAAVVPGFHWFTGHKDEVLITVTYGEAAFWFLLLVILLKVAHYTRSPGQ